MTAFFPGSQIHLYNCVVSKRSGRSRPLSQSSHPEELNAVNVATALNQLAKRRDARDALLGTLAPLCLKLEKHHPLVYCVWWFSDDGGFPVDGEKHGKTTTEMKTIIIIPMNMAIFGAHFQRHFGDSWNIVT